MGNSSLGGLLQPLQSNTNASSCAYRIKKTKYLHVLYFTIVAYFLLSETPFYPDVQKGTVDF
ncbi:MAG: hypothetical protein ACYS4T_19890, partial [Planctomycetota bacterium]